MNGLRPDTGLYYEEFKVGAVYRTGTHRITGDEIVRFACLTGDDNPLHTDPTAARAAGFEDVIAHGLLVQALAMGLIADLGIMRGTTIALLGAELRFVAPTVAGDEIHVNVRITHKRKRARRPQGILYRRATVVNQRERSVLEGRLVTLMRNRAGEP